MANESFPGSQETSSSKGDELEAYDIPEEILERLRASARELSSGERNPELRQEVYKSALKYLCEQVSRTRGALS